MSLVLDAGAFIAFELGDPLMAAPVRVLAALELARANSRDQ